MLRTLSVVLCFVLLSSAAQAAIIPGGGFEGGSTPAGFTSAGNTATVAIVGGGGPSIAPEGSFFRAASTGGSTSSLAAGTGLAAFFTGNPAGGTSGSVTEYSGFSFDLTLTGPSFASLMMNIATDEISGGVEDIVAIYIDSGSGPVLQGGFVIDSFGGTTYAAGFTGLVAGDFVTPGITDAAIGSFSDGQTGWFPAFATLGAGSHTVYVLVADMGDTAADTAVFVDAIDITAVPEPGTWLLFGLGALGLVGYRRRMKKKSA